MRAGDSLNLRPATATDLPAVVALINGAYRGKGASLGWTTEAAYIDGDRTSLDLLTEEMTAEPEGVLLVWPPEGPISACCWLAPKGEGVWYLGSLTVHPARQAAGLGRRVLDAAENWVFARQGRTMRLTVVHIRATLIAWYERRGYRLTGRTEPFPYGDERYGVPRRDDLTFVVMEKMLTLHDSR